jgi:hypothetical protein
MPTSPVPTREGDEDDRGVVLEPLRATTASPSPAPSAPSSLAPGRMIAAGLTTPSGDDTVS